MTRLVDRLGRTGFAAATSLVWALPMAAWAGTADLSPIDKTAYPWVALAVGVAMLVLWVAMLARLRAIPVTPRQRRLDIAQMSAAEKCWTLALVAFATGLIAWLNAAATVDPAPLVSAVGEGRTGPTLLAAGLLAFLLVMVAGVALSWVRSSREFRRRRERA